MKKCWLFDSGFKTVFVIGQIFFFALKEKFVTSPNSSQTINLSSPAPTPTSTQAFYPHSDTNSPSFNLNSSQKSTPRSILKCPNLNDTSLDIPLSVLIHPALAQNPNSIQADSAYVSDFNNSINV